MNDIKQIIEKTKGDRQG